MDNVEMAKILTNLDEHFYTQLKQYPLPPYTVVTWGRDCDMCESTEVCTLMTYISLVRHYSGWIEGSDWWEGPNSWTLSDPLPEGRSTRDRILEARENGSNYLV